jgi:superfamily II DNA/RNA helicase
MFEHYAPLLEKLNITALNPMQERALETIQHKDNVVLISPTGSGKTLAFLLPCIRLLQSGQHHVQLLIVVPSRELAIQTEQVFKKMGTGFKVSTCYGGHAVSIEENNLLEPPAVLIGTPGRIGHHIRTGALNLEKTQTLVLDEFDKSLEAGFDEDMSHIITRCSHLKKRILTSATAGEEIPAFVGLQNPVQLNFSQESETAKATLRIKSVRVAGDDKLEALMLLLGKVAQGSVIVFCNHREAVDRISQQLREFNIGHGIYHGGMEQPDREKTLIRLRNQSVRLLVATDLAARGLDIPEIETIIHYQLPMTEDSMIHRNGRTARMQASGTVYFLLDQDDHLPKFLDVEPEEEKLPRNFVMPPASDWATLYISAGKKDKVNKTDIVGMLIRKGKLQKEEVGRIEVLDHVAYVAVKTAKANAVLQLVKGEKVKNLKVKIAVAS